MVLTEKKEGLLCCKPEGNIDGTGVHGSCWTSQKYWPDKFFRAWKNPSSFPNV